MKRTRHYIENNYSGIQTWSNQNNNEDATSKLKGTTVTTETSSKSKHLTDNTLDGVPEGRTRSIAVVHKKEKPTITATYLGNFADYDSISAIEEKDSISKTGAGFKQETSEKSEAWYKIYKRKSDNGLWCFHVDESGLLEAKSRF